MRHILLLVLLSFFIAPGCTVLKGKSDSIQDEFADEGDEFMEDDEEYADEEDEEEYTDEEDEEEYADEEMEEEKPKKKGLKGFFSRLFGGGSSDEDEEYEDEEYEDEEYADEEDEDFADDEENETSQEEMADFFDESEESVQEGTTQEEPSSTDAPKTVASSPPEQSPNETDQAVETPIEKPKIIPLKKIKRTPYRKAGYLVNAVYIARPGDTLEDISQQIYGSNQSEDLRKINPHLRSRSVKVGDKIYYNSPFRKEDDSRLLFYYQDVNSPSTIYNLSPGENIRQVASQLLGHPNSWKEIWATNPELESKGEITGHISIVYWPKDTATGPPPSQTEEFPTVREDEQEQLGDVPPAEEVFPPPIEDKQQQKEPKKASDSGGMIKQKEIILALLVIIILLILIVRLIFKKRKHRDFDYTATNIEV